jgi:hypothetical protein
MGVKSRKVSAKGPFRGGGEPPSSRLIKNMQIIMLNKYFGSFTNED